MKNTKLRNLSYCVYALLIIVALYGVTLEHATGNVIWRIIFSLPISLVGASVLFFGKPEILSENTNKDLAYAFMAAGPLIILGGFFPGA